MDEDRRRFRRFILASVLGHAVVVLSLVISPEWLSPAPGIPGVVVVDLVTVAPGLVPGPPPAPAAKPPARPAAKPVAPPEPVAPPKPPPPVVNKMVLPKEAQAQPKPQQKPAEKAVAKPEPKQVSYEELMKDLREDAGEKRPAEVAQVRTGAADARSATAGNPDAGGGGTVKVSPEMMAWIRDTRIHVRKAWIKTPGFERLSTTLLVTLDETGNVIGEPRVKQRSGNVFYDDSVVRAIQKASPLPRPPRAGDFPFEFPSEES
jgi:colicin import membrane protein